MKANTWLRALRKHNAHPGHHAQNACCTLPYTPPVAHDVSRVENSIKCVIQRIRRTVVKEQWHYASVFWLCKRDISHLRQEKKRGWIPRKGHCPVLQTSSFFWVLNLILAELVAFWAEIGKLVQYRQSRGLDRLIGCDVSFDRASLVNSNDNWRHEYLFEYVF